MYFGLGLISKYKKEVAQHDMLGQLLFYIQTYLQFFNDASIKSRNSGCGFVGLEMNSGWN